MEANWEVAINFVLEREGGYVNDPNDPGKATSFGISQKAYPKLNIQTLTINQAKEIYHQDYWKASGADAMPWPMDIIVFDTAVNCGVFRATTWLNVPKLKTPTGYLMQRLKHYNGLKLELRKNYLSGWLNRVLALYDLIEARGNGI